MWLQLTDFLWSFVSPLFKRICVDFETIQDTVQKPPENTDDIIQLIDYINYAKTQGIPELKERIQVTLWHICLQLCLTMIDCSSHPLCFDRRSTVDSSISVKFTLLRGMKWSLMQKFLYGQRKSSASLSSAMRYSSLTLGNIVYCWHGGDPRGPHKGKWQPRGKKDCQHLCLYQVIETAKEKEMDELLAKRGRLRVQLEKVLRRITEFPFFSELDMVQQVWSLPGFFL